MDMGSARTIQDLHRAFTPLHMMSDVVLFTTLFHRAPMDQVLLTDFFGSVMKVRDWSGEGIFRQEGA
jgi:glycosylphosphatidylinositol transamidase (GPIT) subunit GPI8